MKSAFCLPILIALCLCACSSTRFISVALKNAALDLPIDSERVKAGGVWRQVESGHGLEIYVWANRDIGDYERNLDLELEGAAKVCAALAMNDRVLEWAYIDVYFFNRYQRVSSTSRDVVGVAEVIMRRETLLMLRERNTPATEYPRYWRFLSGYKDQPDSKTLLSW